MKMRLSSGATRIYAQVLQAMQNAEEIGGVYDEKDYLLLMTAIRDECDRRSITVAAEILAQRELAEKKRKALEKAMRIDSTRALFLTA